jgi:hypothetical protein
MWCAHLLLSAARRHSSGVQRVVHANTLPHETVCPYSKPSQYTGHLFNILTNTNRFSVYIPEYTGIGVLSRLGKVYSNGLRTFSKCVLCYFANLTVFDINLLQIKIQFFKANRTTDITLYRANLIFTSI